MDERLEEILKAAKEGVLRTMAEQELRIQQEAKDRASRIERFREEAEGWVNEHLFSLISLASENGKTSVVLNSGYSTMIADKTGIPNEAIQAVINKIDGLRCEADLKKINLAGKDYPPDSRVVYTVHWELG